MPNHELAFADIMSQLLGQTPDRADDPPVQPAQPVKRDDEDSVFTDVDLSAVLGLTPEVVEVKGVEPKPEEMAGLPGTESSVMAGVTEDVVDRKVNDVFARFKRKAGV